MLTPTERIAATALLAVGGLFFTTTVLFYAELVPVWLVGAAASVFAVSVFSGVLWLIWSK